MADSTRFLLHTLLAATITCTSAPTFAQQASTTPSQEVDTAKSFRITPLRPVEELRVEAARQQPPREHGKRPSELVEVTRLDPQIHLEVRYASSNNFMGSPMYTEARAYLQRPVAEALLRVEKWLEPQGYGLLIHDAYRPWSVTWMFWQATPDDKKIFVADPKQGSRHNRGCAVDLTLYDRKTGKAVAMPSGYDEMSKRAYSDYAGGTAEQNQNRALLRRAMEREGFMVNPTEWWHFDHKLSNQYPIGNESFEELDGKVAAR